MSSLFIHITNFKITITNRNSKFSSITLNLDQLQYDWQILLRVIRVDRYYNWIDEYYELTDKYNVWANESTNEYYEWTSTTS